MRRRAAVAALLGVAAAVPLLVACSGKAKTDADFCALAVSQEKQTETFNAAFTSDRPDQLKPVVEQALTQLMNYDDAAPPAIAGAVHTYVTDEKAFLTIVKNNGYDVSKATAAITKAVSDPAFMKAGTQITTYLMTTCHLGASATATPTGG